MSTEPTAVERTIAEVIFANRHRATEGLTQAVVAAIRNLPPAEMAELRPESAMAEWTREMHYHLGAHVNEGEPTADIPDELRDIRIALLDEEVGEYREAAAAGDLVGIADGLADVVYVAYGTAHTYGIPLDAVLAEVHRSNMSKSPNPDGGKFIKGPDYTPPRVALILKPPQTGPWLAFPGKRPVCRDCGADWSPVRRGECVACGSDSGPLPSGGEPNAVDAGDREPASEVLACWNPAECSAQGTCGDASEVQP